MTMNVNNLTAAGNSSYYKQTYYQNIQISKRFQMCSNQIFYVLNSYEFEKYCILKKI